MNRYDLIFTPEGQGKLAALNRYVAAATATNNPSGTLLAFLCASAFEVTIADMCRLFLCGCILLQWCAHAETKGILSVASHEA